MNYRSEDEFPEMAETTTRQRFGGSMSTVKMDSTVITLAVAIDDAMSQAEKLMAMCVELSQRLEPVRRDRDSETVMKTLAMDNANRPRQECGSPYASRVVNISDILKNVQEQINRTLNDLDV